LLCQICRGAGSKAVRCCAELARRLRGELACARQLFRVRWSNGFIALKGWELSGKRLRATVLGHGREGDALQQAAADAVVHCRRYGHHPFQQDLQAQLRLGSYKTACLLLHKLRRAMVDPDRTPLVDLIEADESETVYRTKQDPAHGGQDRSDVGKLLIIGAVGLSPGGRRVTAHPPRALALHHGKPRRLFRRPRRDWRLDSRRRAASLLRAGLWNPGIRGRLVILHRIRHL
jgi:hypothetical protein